MLKIEGTRSEETHGTALVSNKTQRLIPNPPASHPPKMKTLMVKAQSKGDRLDGVTTSGS